MSEETKLPKQISAKLNSREDIIQFRKIKEMMGASTDVDVIRRLIQYYMTGTWLERVLLKFQDSLILELHRTLLFRDLIPPQPSR
jgi:hypothetical protein